MTVDEGITIYLEDLQRFARSLVGPGRKHDAEDLVQNCIVRALEKSAQFEEGTNLKAWLFTVMRSLFISDRRHDKVCRRYAESVSRGPALVTQPDQYCHVMLRQTARSMKTLAGEDIRNLRDLAIAEQSHETAAARRGVPIGTMKSRLSRSRAKLRRAMKIDDGPVSTSLAA